MNDLSEVMQDRLDKWRKRGSDQEAKKETKHNPKNYVARKDYADEEKEEWITRQQ